MCTMGSALSGNTKIPFRHYYQGSLCDPDGKGLYNFLYDYDQFKELQHELCPARTHIYWIGWS
ncbi:hypothetical protein HNR37_001779 [Desulfurispira natronophila]|uniref:Uncharacterized protein n=1 Tax=Desulfurispira natronophila TaxID=682562 RepID=A0A7W8DHJ4_9BACT|nr:hypothetical protein [Desulfurispira natronophila]